jgi:hypothetical protein
MTASIAVDLLVYEERLHLARHHPGDRQGQVRNELVGLVVGDDVSRILQTLFVELRFEHRIGEITRHDADAESLHFERFDVFEAPREHRILGPEIRHGALYPFLLVEPVPSRDQYGDARSRRAWRSLHSEFEKSQEFAQSDLRRYLGRFSDLRASSHSEYSAGKAAFEAGFMMAAIL